MSNKTKLYDRFYIGSAPLSAEGFDVVALCAAEYQPPSQNLAPARVVRVPLRDREVPLTRTERHLLQRSVILLCDLWMSGQSVLVSCVMGRNRSALVSALTLAEIVDVTPQQAGEHIRSVRRDAWGVPALENATFRRYLKEASSTY